MPRKPARSVSTRSPETTATQLAADAVVGTAVNTVRDDSIKKINYIDGFVKSVCMLHVFHLASSVKQRVTQYFA